jgi:hypothetical protein
MLRGMYEILTYIEIAQNHERRLHNHPNTEAIQLLNYREATRRLNRTKPLELC